MNKLKGRISKIDKKRELSLISVECEGIEILSFALTEEFDLKEGDKVFILFKESETVLAKNLKGLISIRNRLECVVEEVEKGDILAQVKLFFNENRIVSVVSKKACKEMDIKKGDRVTVLVKTNEITLMEIKDE